MSQVYESEKNRVEGRGLNLRVGKSCILDSHLWTRIGRVWESRNSYFLLLNSSMFEKESTIWSVTFSCVCLFVSNCYQCLLWYYPTPNSMSFTFYCWDVTLMRRLNLWNTIIEGTKITKFSRQVQRSLVVELTERSFNWAHNLVLRTICVISFSWSVDKVSGTELLLRGVKL